jgi:hypothetical protein
MRLSPQGNGGYEEEEEEDEAVVGRNVKQDKPLFLDDDDTMMESGEEIEIAGSADTRAAVPERQGSCLCFCYVHLSWAWDPLRLCPVPSN